MDTTLELHDFTQLVRGNIRARRIELGLTQEELARAIGCKSSYISMLESERLSRLPALPTMLRIANALRTSVPALTAEKSFSEISA